MNIEKKNIVEEIYFSEQVSKIFGRPYQYQQQDGCQDRGIKWFNVPTDYSMEDEMNEDVPWEVNGVEMGVKWETWINKDPNTRLFKYEWEDSLVWERNFYPDICTLLNKLHEMGELPEGKLGINIDW